MKLRAVARVAVAAVVVALLTLSFSGGGRHVARADDAVPPPLSADGPVTKDGKEITSLRTRTSRTFQAPTGSFVAVVGQGSLNFKDAAGNWQPIDNKLSADGNGTFHNGANRYKVDLPAKLESGPIKIQLGDDAVGFSLRGAQASAAVEGRRRPTRTRCRRRR